MKRRLLIALVVTIALSLGTTGLVIAGDGSLPPAEGQSVYDYITKTDPYQFDLSTGVAVVPQACIHRSRKPFTSARIAVPTSRFHAARPGISS